MSNAEQPLGRDLKIVFLLVGILTFVVGLVMFFFPGPSGVGSAPVTQPPVGDQWWPWPLRTPLITRFFGALFASVGMGAFWAMRQPAWRDVRGLFLPGITFTALATLASFLHFSSFDQSRLTTWLFFGIYLVVLGAGIWTFVRYERLRA